MIITYIVREVLHFLSLMSGENFKIITGGRPTHLTKLPHFLLKQSDHGLTGNAFVFHSFSAVLSSEAFGPEIKETFIRHSGVTQASQRISIRIREYKNLRKAVKVIEKRFLCEMCRFDPYVMLQAKIFQYESAIKINFV